MVEVQPWGTKLLRRGSEALTATSVRLSVVNLLRAPEEQLRNMA